MGTVDTAGSEGSFLQRLEDMPQDQKSTWSLRLGVCSFFLFLVVLIAHFSTVTKEAHSPMKQMIITTDGDPTDFIGIRYLLARGDVDVKMIVLVGTGWSQSLFAAHTTITGFLKTEEGKKVPTVTYGHSFTTNGNLNCTMMRAIDPFAQINNDLRWGAGIPGGMKSVQSTDDRPVMFETPLSTLLEAADLRSVGIVSLAPLTDIAWYFGRHPSHAAKIEKVFVEGGVFSTGNVKELFAGNKVSELNFFFDPAAAKSVVDDRSPSAFDVDLFPLDASRRCDVSQSNAILQGVVSEKGSWLWKATQGFLNDRSVTEGGSKLLASWPLLGPLYASVAAGHGGNINGFTQQAYLRVWGDASQLDDAGRVHSSSKGAVTTVYLHYDCPWLQQHVAALF